uniref:Uncharacterized protein n=1 Tax=Chromera velia CCMP2878 TaxID=1169474 RepID=A0A0G4GY12_9ALVE|eukprot:Cvel_5383.t1-p1 / transcript=Cvel_5383.t1 / gene=Cvel_5383 / organism=Chromera_velia_CCMP2878 / gene_product=hypothetical protein / transcript_product=hypothetical protein / location=Cvel_scaffold250:75743-79827(-) / protein_length=754 / sequence_SO=supercontig / SO=protein_coding / is_pseudo=false
MKHSEQEARMTGGPPRPTKDRQKHPLEVDLSDEQGNTHLAEGKKKKKKQKQKSSESLLSPQKDASAEGSLLSGWNPTPTLNPRSTARSGPSASSLQQQRTIGADDDECAKTANRNSKRGDDRGVGGDLESSPPLPLSLPLKPLTSPPQLSDDAFPSLSCARKRTAAVSELMPVGQEGQEDPREGLPLSEAGADSFIQDDMDGECPFGIPSEEEDDLEKGAAAISAPHPHSYSHSQWSLSQPNGSHGVKGDLLAVGDWRTKCNLTEDRSEVAPPMVHGKEEEHEHRHMLFASAVHSSSAFPSSVASEDMDALNARRTGRQPFECSGEDSWRPLKCASTRLGPAAGKRDALTKHPPPSRTQGPPPCLPMVPSLQHFNHMHMGPFLIPFSQHSSPPPDEFPWPSFSQPPGALHGNSSGHTEKQSRSSPRGSLAGSSRRGKSTGRNRNGRGPAEAPDQHMHPHTLPMQLYQQTHKREMRAASNGIITQIPPIMPPQLQSLSFSYYQHSFQFSGGESMPVGQEGQRDPRETPSLSAARADSFIQDDPESDGECPFGIPSEEEDVLEKGAAAISASHPHSHSHSQWGFSEPNGANFDSGVQPLMRPQKRVKFSRGTERVYERGSDWAEFLSQKVVSKNEIWRRGQSRRGVKLLPSSCRSSPEQETETAVAASCATRNPASLSLGARPLKSILKQSGLSQMLPKDIKRDATVQERVWFRTVEGDKARRKLVLRLGLCPKKGIAQVTKMGGKSKVGEHLKKK